MALPERDQDAGIAARGTPISASVGQSKNGIAYVIAGIAALGGLLFGYDTGVISGATLFLRKEFTLNSFTEELAVSSILIGTIIGAAIGGRMGDAIGRKRTLIITSVVFAVGAVLTALSPNLTVFILFRILVGLAVGVASLTVPIYIAEMAPPAMRGSLVTFNQLAITIGIAVAYWVDLAFAANGQGWRPMFAIACIPGLILLGGMFFLHETPRWLASKGRWDEAEQALTRTLNDQEKDNELKSIRDSVKDEKKISQRQVYRELTASPYKLALTVGVGLAVLQQFVGINTVIYYAPTIFGYAGFSSPSGAILATSVVGVINVLSTIVAIFVLDRIGRKPLLLTGSIGMALTLIGMGVVFAVGAANAGILILICLLLYIFFFAIGMGPVFWLLNSEIFPTRLRSTGSSLSTMANWGANLLVSITFLSLIGAIGKPFTFWLYAILAVVTFFFCRLLVPETKGKRLEEIEGYWKEHSK